MDKVQETGLLSKVNLGFSKAKHFYGRNQLIVDIETRATASEAHRKLNTNIAFKNVGGNLRYVAITSSLPGEGKSSPSANITITLAKGGHRAIKQTENQLNMVGEKILGTILNGLYSIDRDNYY